MKRFKEIFHRRERESPEHPGELGQLNKPEENDGSQSDNHSKKEHVKETGVDQSEVGPVSKTSDPYTLKDQRCENPGKMEEIPKLSDQREGESPEHTGEAAQLNESEKEEVSDSDNDSEDEHSSTNETDIDQSEPEPVSTTSDPISADFSKSQPEKTKKLRDELFNAMSKDDVEALQSAIQAIENHKLTLEKQEIRDPFNGMTILHAALDQRKFRVASCLIESQTEYFLSASFINIPKQIPPSKKTSLHLVAEVGDKELMEKLLKKLSIIIPSSTYTNGEGWVVTTPDFKTERVVIKMHIPSGKRRLTAIHVAAINGHSQLIKPLLTNGFNVDSEDNENETPLILAVRLGHLGTIKELIGNNANINHENNYGCTALHHAVSQGRKDIVKLLLEEGKADLNIERIKSPKTPIEMAANRNELKLVKALLRGNIEIEYRHRALMIAATKGNLDIVKCLIETDTDEKLINRPDDNGSTALFEAASGNSLPTIKYLLDKQSFLWIRFDMPTALDIAMLNPNNSVLQFLLESARRLYDMDTEILYMYLHVAAKYGDIEKIEYLLASGFDFYARDEYQNTFLHTAAAHNKATVLEMFIIPPVDIDTLINSEGETLLHVAAKRGSLDCVKMLIKHKSKLNIPDKNGNNSLHAALSSTTISTPVVTALTEAIIESNVVIFNEQDILGRTALHLAVAVENTDIFKFLLDVDPGIENKEGDIPLHIAAEFRTVEVLKTYLEAFSDRLKKGQIDHKDVNGFSALHRCVKIANAEKVELMLHHGADLSLTDENGKTVLHTMVDNYVDNPTFDDNLVEVYKTIVRNATKWYCLRNDMTMPKEESIEFYLIQIDAVRLLTSEMFSCGLNVLQYASKRGADKLLKEILNTLNIYRFDKYRPIPLKGQGLDELRNSESMHEQHRQHLHLLTILKEENNEVIFDGIVLDVTYLVPQLMPRNLFSKGDQMKMSCLELIINQGNDDMALKFLAVNPLRSLVSNYWKLCRQTYEAFMWIHVIFMVCFTYFMMPSYDWLHLRFGTNSSTVDPNDHSNNLARAYSPYVFGVFLLWPVFNLFYTCVFIQGNIFDLQRILTKRKQNVGEITLGLLRFPIGILIFVFDNLSLISSTCFGISQLSWYIMFIHSDNAHRYLECHGMAFIFGWLHTISFVKGFKDWNATAAILKRILLKDISRFIYIYVFFSVTFGYAIHVITQADYHLDPDHRSATSSIYLTFYWMLNPGDVLLVSESEEYKRSGGSVTVLRAVCLAYSILSSLVLTNLLIAMMKSTYTIIATEKPTAWPIESLRMALWVERHFPLRQLKLLTMKDTLYDFMQNRWYMKCKVEMEIRMKRSVKKLSVCMRSRMETRRMIKTQSGICTTEKKKIASGLKTHKSMIQRR